jgi:hypothetical protein
MTASIEAYCVTVVQPMTARNMEMTRRSFCLCVVTGAGYQARQNTIVPHRPAWLVEGRLHVTEIEFDEWDDASRRRLNRQIDAMCEGIFVNG